MLKGTPSIGTEGAKRKRFVHNQTVAKLSLDFGNLIQRRDGAPILIQALHHDEPSLIRRVAFETEVGFSDPLEHIAQIFHVIVPKVHHVGPAQGDAGIEGLVDGLVHDEEVAALGKGRHGRRGRRGTVGVHDGAVRSHVIRDGILEVQVGIDGAVEATGTAGATAISGQSSAGGTLDRRRWQ